MKFFFSLNLNIYASKPPQLSDLTSAAIIARIAKTRVDSLLAVLAVKTGRIYGLNKQNLMVS